MTLARIAVAAVIVVACASLASAQFGSGDAAGVDTTLIRRSTFILDVNETNEDNMWFQTYGQSNLILCGNFKYSRCSNFDTSTSPPTRVATLYTENYQWADDQNTLYNGRLYYYTQGNSANNYGVIAEVQLSDMSRIANHTAPAGNYGGDYWYQAVINDGSDLYATAMEYNATTDDYYSTFIHYDITGGAFTQLATYNTSADLGDGQLSELYWMVLDNETIFAFFYDNDPVLGAIPRDFASQTTWVYTYNSYDSILVDDTFVYAAWSGEGFGAIDKFSKSTLTYRGEFAVVRQDGTTVLDNGFNFAAADWTNGFIYLGTDSEPYELFKVSPIDFSVVANVTSNYANSEGDLNFIAVNSITGQVFVTDYDSGVDLAEYGPAVLCPCAAPNTTAASNNAVAGNALTQNQAVGIGVGVAAFGVILIIVVVVLLMRKAPGGDQAQASAEPTQSATTA